MWLYVCVSRRETFRGRWYHSDCLEDFFWFLRKVRWQFDRRRRGGGAKPLIPTDDKRAQLLYAFWVLLPCLMFRPSPSGFCKYVRNVQSSGLSHSVQSTVGSRTHPPAPQWVMRQWFVGVCEACVIFKGKRGRILNQEQGTNAISSQHKAALQAAFSIATGWIWPNKRQTGRKFRPVPADKRVLFHQLMRFLLENVRI